MEDLEGTGILPEAENGENLEETTNVLLDPFGPNTIDNSVPFVENPSVPNIIDNSVPVVQNNDVLPLHNNENGSDVSTWDKRDSEDIQPDKDSSENQKPNKMKGA